MDKRQTEVRTLKKGGYVIVDDEPCVIMNITSSKPGKHGAAKARMDVIGIFDGQKRSIVQPVTAKIYVPIVERKTAQVLSVTKDTVQLMDMETYETFELPLKDEYKEKIEQGKEVMYLESLGKRKLDIQ
ncbi:MAG: translation initiation factor IF-5A [Candidatus Methanoliparum thermophilum]|uniref:Translation initiation factor 5A n=1 Tax=Methanoliparum thermophilum TaxID=2491083 RepID=A0A520KTB3_METT2|nr:translation initiation factor IF-5A [Candidatus Methanoliparum sp. LAM-1]RZN65215.1 MAG: translation initiation factor IF-5A [Candidatus Methanoliparum thermophilum]BDC36601.1 translation initiation factor IF-5A [Candidatus Methanoliparum sp. LAM-1]